jgi:hypothetical protein
MREPTKCSQSALLNGVCVCVCGYLLSE